MYEIFTRAGTVSTLQFASQGKWEESLVLRTSEVDTPGAVRKFREWAPGQVGERAEFAIEVFGSLDAADDCFVGARFENFTDRRFEGVEAYVAEIFSGGLGLSQAIPRLGDIAGGVLLQGVPDFLELGMFNNWIPFGPVTFWRRGDAARPQDALAKVLGEHGRYLVPVSAPIVVEIAYPEPLRHWAGFRVSRLSADGNYVLDTDLAEALIGSVDL